MADYTGLINSRLPGVQGGANWLLNIARSTTPLRTPPHAHCNLPSSQIIALATKLGATRIYYDFATDFVVKQSLGWAFVRGLVEALLLAFGVFIKAMNREYRCVRRGAASEASARAKRARERSEHKRRSSLGASEAARRWGRAKRAQRKEVVVAPGLAGEGSRSPHPPTDPPFLPGPLSSAPRRPTSGSSRTFSMAAATPSARTSWSSTRPSGRGSSRR